MRRLSRNALSRKSADFGLKYPEALPITEWWNFTSEQRELIELARSLCDTAHCETHDWTGQRIVRVSCDHVYYPYDNDFANYIWQESYLNDPSEITELLQKFCLMHLDGPTYHEVDRSNWHWD